MSIESQMYDKCMRIMHADGPFMLVSMDDWSSEDLTALCQAKPGDVILVPRAALENMRFVNVQEPSVYGCIAGWISDET